MRWQDVKNHLKRVPFEPFRVYLSDGSSYEIPHPDFAYVTGREVVIGRGALDENTPERSVYCNPLHITRIEPLVDGRKRRKRNNRKRNQ